MAGAWMEFFLGGGWLLEHSTDFELRGAGGGGGLIRNRRPATPPDPRVVDVAVRGHHQRPPGPQPIDRTGPGLGNSTSPSPFLGVSRDRRIVSKSRSQESL